MTRCRAATVFAALSLFVAGLARPVESQTKSRRPDLAGTWRYNALRSDRIEDKLQILDPFARGPGGPTAGPPQGGLPEGGRPQTGPGEQRSGGMPYGRSGGMSDQGLMIDLRRPPQAITIGLTDSSVVISDEAGHALHLPTNGKKIREEVPGGIRIDRTAEWRKDGDLRVRQKSSSVVLQHTFRLDTVTGRLTVLARFESDRLPEAIEFRRVYDRVPPGK